VENALPSSKAKVGWYARVENNGWRLVSDRLLNNLWDPVTYRTTNKPVAFHHNKVVYIDFMPANCSSFLVVGLFQ
jgi:hypothetical protein